MTLEMLCVMSPDGTVPADLDPGLPDDDLKALFSTMLLTRVFDERMLRLQRQGRLGFYLTSTGEEASAIGAAYALEANDWIFLCYRETGAILQRGITPAQMITQCFGKAGDVTKGRQMPVHYSFREANLVSISSPVGTQIPHAAGTAYAQKFKGDRAVSCVFFGEGTTSQGDFHVGLNFAGVFETPVIFMCRNNQFAISTPIEKQTRSTSFAIKAEGYGIKGVLVDGTDILAVIQVVSEARERGLRGEGPTLIECHMYRLGAHSTSDDPSRYADMEQLEEWRRTQDPLVKFRAYLTQKGLWSQEWEDSLRAGFAVEIKAAIESAEASPLPHIRTLFEDIYAEESLQLREQKADLAQFYPEVLL